MRDWLLLAAAVTVGGLISGTVMLVWFAYGYCW